MNNIPGKIIAITTSFLPAGYSNGNFILHTVLTDQGELYENYVSDGKANVPDDGLWRKVSLKVFDTNDHV